MWWRYILAVVAGAILGLFPNTTQNTLNIFKSIAELLTNIGVYLVFPAAFSGIIVAINYLTKHRWLLQTITRTILIIMIFVVGGSILGTVIGLGLIPDRIPPTPQEAELLAAPSVIDQLLEIFPENIFNVFTHSPSNLLPIVVLAFIIGLAIMHEKETVTDLLKFSQSAWRIMRKLLSIGVEILAVLCVFLAAYCVLQIRTIIEIRIFLTLILVQLVSVMLIVCVLYPLLLAMLIGLSPTTWFLRTLPPAISALVTGNALFCLPALYTLDTRNIPEPSNNITSTLGILFCRAGTALVASSSFIVVLRSYSTLEIQFQQVLFITILAVFFSITIPYASGQSVLAVLSMLSLAYNPDIQELYFILLPIMLILTHVATFMDIMTISFMNYITGAQYKNVLKLYSQRNYR